ncbi:DUF2225 domain-containing protein [Thermosediminibacter litoriperuensis]|uniref:DUF2225 domain-containing protein n=1 Tax=Thermosediminibacter litoriperuensis TaxID=291989 RepID=A0A5S5AYN9_9FIRM|nr:DUF2225 domain-containing protein [Thermosediminibacter litoriperuensis]TYP58752.1 hypothetical protein LZ11_00207 [Thermosediminibacter litoriperuensis]
MQVERLLYQKEEECPICGTKFMSARVRHSKLHKKCNDTDFLMHYEENFYPFFYDVTICSECGYAAFESIFRQIGHKEKEKVKEELKKVRWGGRIPLERSLSTAELVYKMGIYTAQAKNEKASVMAQLCHRLAWVYRIMGNIEEENKFLEHAVRFYEMAAERERIQNEAKQFYLIGELNRMLGKEERAVKWLQIVIMDRSLPENNVIKEMARQSWEKVRAKAKQNNHTFSP